MFSRDGAQEYRVNDLHFFLYDRAMSLLEVDACLDILRDTIKGSNWRLAGVEELEVLVEDIECRMTRDNPFLNYERAYLVSYNLPTRVAKVANLDRLESVKEKKFPGTECYGFVFLKE